MSIESEHLAQGQIDDRDVTVVIVTYNSAVTIEETLASLANQTYPEESYEVIVVDGGSSDHTREIVEGFDVRLVTADGAGIGKCRNHGINISEGTYVTFTDSDCRVPPTWLEDLVTRMEAYESDSRVIGGGGANVAFDDDPMFAKVIGSMQRTFLGSGGSPQSKAIDEIRLVKSVAACNAIYRRDVFEDYRFNDAVNVGEDAEFNFRLAHDGYRLFYDPDIVVRHHLPPTLQTFARKSYLYGNAMARIQCRHRRVIRWYSFLPSIALFGGGILLLYDLREKSHYFLLLLITYVPIAIYTVLTVYREHRTPLALAAPILLALQYVTYGIGFVKGLDIRDG